MDQFSQPSQRQTLSRAVEKTPQPFKVKIEGMTCTACAAKVSSALQRDQRVSSAMVDFATATGVISGSLAFEEVQKIVASVGYKAFTQESSNDETSRHKKERLKLKELVVATLLVTPVMLLAMTPLHVKSSGEIQAFFATLFVFGPARSYHVRAVKQLRYGTVSMDTLVSLGMLSAWGLSLVMLTQQMSHLYFESSVMIGYFVLVGKTIEDFARHRSVRAVDSLLKLRPKVVRRRLSTGEVRDEAFEQIKLGDVLYIRPGDLVPCDGVVLGDSSSFDESIVTGESEPVLRHNGEMVQSGAVNVATHGVDIQVSRIGKDTSVEKLIAMIDDARLSRPSIQKIADQISAVFVPAILLIAGLTWFIWYEVGLPPIDAMMRGLSTLVVACPCALGLATPIAWITGLGAAAQKGIFIKNFDALEAFNKVDTLLFDKTGTLTDAEPQVINVIGDLKEKLSMLSVFSAMTHSHHPMARSVLKWIKNHYDTSEAPLSKLLEEVSGKGVRCEMRNPQKDLVLFGRPDFVTSSIPDSWREVLSHESSVVGSAINGESLFLFELENKIRPEVNQFLEELGQREIQVHVMSGDRQEVVDKLKPVFPKVTSFKGELTPEHKKNEVSQFQAQGRKVAFVGDGMNDGPVLAMADVGIALAHGADIATHSAGIVLLRPGLSALSDAMRLSERMSKIIKQNFFWAFFYNLVSIPLAVFGLMGPMEASAAMVLSSLSVVLNASRLRKI